MLSIESMRVFLALNFLDNFLRLDAILVVSSCILSTGLWQLFSVSATVFSPFLRHKYMAFSFSERPRVCNFNEKRKWQYLFVDIKSTPMCLLCSAKVTIPKKHDVERNFNTVHCGFNENFPLGSEL